MKLDLRFRAGYHSRRALMNVEFRPTRDPSVDLLGSDWGGWAVARDSLKPESIVYSGGIGHDATFDVALSERYGCTVHGFDPTPVGRAHGEDVARRHQLFAFHPWGLWDENRTLPFYVPQNPEHDSFSIVNLSHTDDSVLGEVRTLSTTMCDLGHERIDLLKIDIEGAEYAVLGEMLRERLDVRQLCVEFDQPASYRKLRAMVKRLQAAGYVLIFRRTWDYTFLRV